MWGDILKSPYKIESNVVDGDWRNALVHTYNRLFQGTQGEEDTGYWTPALKEALVYSVFGSSVAGFGSSIAGLKLENKPMIKQALKTNKQKWLEGDKEYTNNLIISSKKEMAMARGFSHDEDIEYKYLPDSRVKELIIQLKKDIDEETLDKETIGYIYSAVGMNATIFIQGNELLSHVDETLEKYFR